ncbi:MAG TPA: D-aminoacyl-tRNA deacylase, partial [Nitrospira sp.]
RRPSFEEATQPDEARRLYELVPTELRTQGTVVETGVFGAHMKVDSVNDGPVTFVLDTR